MTDLQTVPSHIAGIWWGIVLHEEIFFQLSDRLVGHAGDGHHQQAIGL